MQKILFIFILICSNILLSQSIVEYNKVLKTDSLRFHKNEVRIYKKTAISTELQMFRLYENNTEKWVGEWYQIEASGNQKSKVQKSTINSLKNLELIWVKILDTDILHLPQWEHIQYKLENKEKNYFTEDGHIVSSKNKTTVLDGVSYYIQIKSYKRENEFEYNNPESYLKIYPTVDELISFQELLALLRSEFNIFQK